MNARVSEHAHALNNSKEYYLICFSHSTEPNCLQSFGPLSLLLISVKSVRTSVHNVHCVTSYCPRLHISGKCCLSSQKMMKHYNFMFAPLLVNETTLKYETRPCICSIWSRETRCMKWPMLLWPCCVFDFKSLISVNTTSIWTCSTACKSIHFQHTGQSKD